MIDIVATAREMRRRAIYGPWRAEPGGAVFTADGSYLVADCHLTQRRTRKGTAEFIAGAPELVDSLCAEIERLRTSNAHYKRVMGIVDRVPMCVCQWEEGDSPCPVHGEIG